MSSGLNATAYAGAAQLTTAAHPDPITVEVDLRGYFEPNDGHFHWYGRIQPTSSLAPSMAGSVAVLETPSGKAEGTLSDVDPWGRFRIAGTGAAPF